MTPPVDDPEAVRRILATTEALLLDFDGPVCSVFAGFPAHVVADQLRDTLTERTRTALPEKVRNSPDPFDVLFYAANLGPQEAHFLEAAFRAHEVEAVQSAEPTPGAHDLIATWTAATGRPLAIVSNNSFAAVQSYLDLHDLREHVAVISARQDADVSLLKPSPHLVTSAVHSLAARPRSCTLVGDSSTDIEAARSAGVCAIGYANKSGKVERFMRINPAAIVTTLSSLVTV